MSYYISNLITKLNEDVDGIIIYNQQTNKLLKVSLPLYSILSNIKEKFGDESINDCDENFLRLTSTDAFKKLLKYKFIYNTTYNNSDSEDYSVRYRNLDTSISITQAYLHVTQKCNLKCTYCYNSHNLNTTPELNTDQLKYIINKLKEVGTKSIIITGGEPLLRKDIVELCAYIKKLKMHVELLTNGSFLNDKKEILKYVDVMIISVDPGNESYNKRIGLNKSDLYSTIKEIPEIHKEKIAIRSVITKGCESLLDDMKNYVTNELSCEFMYVPFLPNCRNDLKYLPDYDKVLGYDKDCAYKPSRCGACYRIIAINSNGDIYPCQNLIKEEFFICNILDSNWLEKLESSPITDTFRKLNVLKIQKCSVCDIKYLCGGGCRALAYNVYGSLDHNLEFMCKDLRKMCIDRVSNINFTRR